MKKANLTKIGATMLLVGMASGIAPCVSAAQAEESLLSYEDAMRCSALHGFFMAVTDESEPAYARHEDLATRWLSMAMERDDADGDRAVEEYQPVLELLIDKANGMENQPEELNGFLMDAFDRCNELEAANKEEFESVETE